MSLNLHDIVNPAISSIVDNQNIQICLPVTSQDSNYNMTTTYTQYNAICQIQLANNQKMEHKHYYQQNTIYKNFYISDDSLTGLNRNIDTIGDYIKWHDLYYKIVEVNYNFNSGWIKVTGAESSDLVSG